MNETGSFISGLSDLFSQGSKLGDGISQFMPDTSGMTQMATPVVDNMAAGGQTLLDPSAGGGGLAEMLANPQKAFGGFQPNNMTMVDAPGVDLSKGLVDVAKLNEPSMMANIGQGLNDYLKGGTVLEDAATLGKGIGGLYESMKKGDLVNEKIAASKDSRQFAKDEQARKKAFLDSYSQGTSSNNSNYYSA